MFVNLILVLLRNNILKFMNQIAPQYYYRRQRQKKEFLLPFLIIISIGIIIILIIQLIFAISGDNKVDLNNKITVYTLADDVDILPSGQSDWINGYNGSILVTGDAIRSGGNSRVILSFNDGNILRMNENSQLIIEKINSDENGLSVLIDFRYGEIWMNKINVDGDYVFKTDHGILYSIGTRFALENKAYETIRVLQGTVQFDVADETKDNKYIQENVIDIGQELSLSEDKWKIIQERKTVDLITAISNEWEDSDWYSWNMREDENPTDFAETVSAVDSQENEEIEMPTVIEEPEDIILEEATKVVPEEVVAEEPTAVSEQNTPSNELESPIVFVTKPEKTPYTFIGEKFILEGTVKGYAKSITIESIVGTGQKDTYKLSKFNAGDKSWSYIAYKGYGNLSEGTNKYIIYAKDANNQSTERIEIEIIVPEGTFKEETEETSATTEEEVKNEEVPSSNEVIESPANLEALQVLSFNGEENKNNYYETNTDRVEIFGSVPSYAKKIIINGFELQFYEMGSKSWKYYAKPVYNNLNIGENKFTAYYLNEAGQKSPVLAFSIVRIE